MPGFGSTGRWKSTVVNFRVPSLLFPLVFFVSGVGAQETGETPQVSLPPAGGSVPEFRSRKMDLAQCVALALEQNTEIRRAKEEVKRKEGVAGLS